MSTAEEPRPVALVTGAYRGLGRETVRQLAEQGYTVVLTGRKSAAGQQAAAELTTAGEVLYHDLDVNDAASIEAIRRFLDERFGYLTVLVNNAAIHYDQQQMVTNVDFRIVEEAWHTNVIGPWQLTNALLVLLRKSKNGRVVNVSSGAGALNGMQAGTPAYAVTKAALNVLTIKFAARLEPDRILVNSVCPGWVRTDMGGAAAPREVAEGARGIVWAATLPADGPTGGFFRDGKPIEW
jgi:NAD(P)-dependent dehydrogenase (short-subunit alcohol dehydrogenase family)